MHDKKILDITDIYELQQLDFLYALDWNEALIVHVTWNVHHMKSRKMVFRQYEAVDDVLVLLFE